MKFLKIGLVFFFSGCFLFFPPKLSEIEQLRKDMNSLIVQIQDKDNTKFYDMMSNPYDVLCLQNAFNARSGLDKAIKETIPINSEVRNDIALAVISCKEAGWYVQ